MDNSERMRDIIREKKLKQEDVARLTKTKQQTVSGWLRSKYINPRAIEKFTRGLGMEVEDFYCTPEYLAKKIKLSPEAFAIAKAIDTLPLAKKEEVIDLINRQLSLFVQGEQQ